MLNNEENIRSNKQTLEQQKMAGTRTNRESKNRYNLLLGVVVLFWFAQYVYIPYQTPFLTGTNATAGMIGIVVGAYGMTQMLLRLPVGVMADCVGRHKIFIMLGTILAAAGSLVRVLMPNAVGFLIANLISGCASSMWISYMILYTDYFDKKEQQKATGKLVMCCNLGMCLGFVFSTVFYRSTGMVVMCIASITVALIGFFLSFAVWEEKKPIPKVSKGRVGHLLSICKNKRLILFSLLAIIQQGVQMSTAMSFTTQVLKNLGASEMFIGASSIYYMLTAVASAKFAAGKTYAKKGPRFYIPLMLISVGLYCFFVPVCGNIYVIFLLQTLAGLSTGVLFSSLTSEAMKEVPQEQHSTAMGFFQAVYAIGMTGFPTMVGALSGKFSMFAGFALLGTIALVGFVCSLLIYKNLGSGRN